MSLFRSKNQQIMILRNPSSSRDSLFKLLLCISLLCPITMSVLGQGLIGTVNNEFTRQPVVRAEVRLFVQDTLVWTAFTSDAGQYVFQSPAAGRATLEIRADGFSTLLQYDLILDGYSTQRLEHLLSPSPVELPDVTVIAQHVRKSPSVRTIDPGDMVLIAGNFEDPIRIAHHQPGIVLLNDQANHLSARGQSPVFNSWYLEGLEIVNPNHTNNAGTLSDLPTAYGGGINLFSAQTLGATDIYTGLRPALYRQNSGATMDMHLHETEKPEWRARAGLIGFELGGGASLNPRGRLDFNFRYSFTGLLTNLGADFGGEKIGFYDGVISYHQHGARHKFKFFAWAGRSTNEFDSITVESEREAYKDFFNIDYGNTLFGTGFRYDVSVNEKSAFRMGAAYSTNASSYTRSGFFELPVHYRIADELRLLSAFFEYTLHHSGRFNTSAGIHYLHRSSDEQYYPFLPFPEETQMRPYLHTTFPLGSRMQIEAGGEILHSFIYEKWIPGYHGQVSWELNTRDHFFAGVRHAPGEPELISFVPDSYVHFSTDLYEVGWHHVAGQMDVSLTAYYLQMSKLLVYLNGEEGRIHLVDYPFDIIYPGVTAFTTNGISAHKGVEGSWNFTSANGWRFSFNQSVYLAERRRKGEEFLPGKYDGRYTTHFSIGKEIIREKKGKNRIWNINLRGMLNGGLLEPVIDTMLSDIFLTTQAQYPGEFSQRLPAFKRVDASITRTTATSNFRWRWSLDIQNVLGLTNVAYHYYDPFLKEIVEQEHLGLIPVLSVQVSW